MHSMPTAKVDSRYNEIRKPLYNWDNSKPENKSDGNDFIFVFNETKFPCIPPLYPSIKLFAFNNDWNFDNYSSTNTSVLGRHNLTTKVYNSSTMQRLEEIMLACIDAYIARQKDRCAELGTSFNESTTKEYFSAIVDAIDMKYKTGLMLFLITGEIPETGYKSDVIDIMSQRNINSYIDALQILSTQDKISKIIKERNCTRSEALEFLCDEI